MAALTRRTPLVMLGVIAGLVVLAACALWIATGLGEVAAAADDPGGAEEIEEAVADAVDGDEVTLASLPVFEAVVVTRDPFETIRPPADATPAATSSNGGGSGGSGDSSEGPCRSGGEVVCEGTVLSVLEVRASEAVIQVDGESFLVAEGDSFAGGRFQLLALSGNCAEIVYRNGDVSEVFTECVGGSATLK